ncbi:MAG: winged helix-turn-helix transcriptional regulator [Eubacteriales bacterium]
MGYDNKKTYAEVPSKIEYSLTELGQSLKPILEATSNWGEEYKTSLN